MLKRFSATVVFSLICLLISPVEAVEKPTSAQKTCVTQECHASYGKKTYVHGPVGLGQCDSCHKAVEPKEHTFKPAREGKELCGYCHLEQASKKIVHKPVESGDCMQCHDPHSSDSKFLVSKATIADLCKDCHEVTADMEFLHGPTAVGECTVCHTSHSSDHQGLLVSDATELCFSCHVVTQEELKKYEHVHEPVATHCTACHDPHGASNATMLKNFAPFLCYMCHRDIEKIAEDSHYMHSAVTDIDGCMKCHTAHASTAKALLKADTMSLCMQCHDKPLPLGDDKELPAFTDQVKDKKFLHGPVAQRDCSGCHAVHGSEYFSLLSKQYPPIFYAPFSEENYELCFGCHAKSVVWTAETEDLTDFRNGTQNLHFLHVNRSKRGRTCRSCHATHGSDRPKHIRETVPYGRWDLPVGFTKTETGGSCLPGCHRQKDYDRVNPADYGAKEQE